LLGFVLTNCNSDVGSSAYVKKYGFSDFSNFPEQPFLELDFTLNKSENSILLTTHNFKLMDAYSLERSKDSTYYVTTLDEDFNDFIIYYKHSDQLNNKKHLLQFLQQNATNYMGNSIFSEMEFSQVENPFKITFFTTDSSIRLHFKKL